MIPEARLQEIEAAVKAGDWFDASEVEPLVAEVRRLREGIQDVTDWSGMTGVARALLRFLVSIPVALLEATIPTRSGGHEPPAWAPPPTRPPSRIRDPDAALTEESEVGQ